MDNQDCVSDFLIGLVGPVRSVSSNQKCHFVSSVLEQNNILEDVIVVRRCLPAEAECAEMILKQFDKLLLGITFLKSLGAVAVPTR